MSNPWQAERMMEQELDRLDRQLEEGQISREEYGKAVRELERDFRDAARESAEEAYERELDSWGYR